LTVALIVGATLITYVVSYSFEASLLLNLGAVILVAWLAGPRWAIAALVASVPLLIFFVLEPRASLRVDDSDDLARLGVFAAVSLMAIALSWLREQSDESRDRIEQRLRLANQAAGMGGWEWDIRSGKVTWSPELQRMHGLQPGTFGGDFAAFSEDIHPDDRERVQQIVARSLETGSHLVDYRIVRPDGEIRWVEGRGNLERGADGTPLKMTGVCMDITTRKEAEEAMRESEERFRSLADGAPVLIWVNGLEGCEFVNTEYLNYLGKELEDVLGMQWAQAVHPDDYESYVGGYQAAFKKRTSFEGQVRLRGADGEYRWFKSVGLPRFTGGSFTGYIGCSFDITDVKSAERELADRADRQRFLLQAGAQLASSLDYETALAYSVNLPVPQFAEYAVIDLVNEDGSISRAAHAHADPARQELLRRLVHEFGVLDNAHHPSRLALAAGTTQFLPDPDDAFLRQHAKDDEHLRLMHELGPGSVIVVPMVSHGRLIGSFSLATGTSGRRFDEVDVQTAEALAQRVAFAIENARLYARSQEIQDELREASRAKDEFLGMVSHELRTPITTIVSGIHILGKNGIEPPSAKEVIGDIEHESERLKMIVENLLALGRAELTELPPEPVSLSTLIRRVAAAARRRRPSREIEIEGTEGLPVVAGNPLYTELVLRNLVDNAQKYSDKAVTIVASNLGDTVEISVLDEGPGVCDDELERIFDRFYRSVESARRASGAGMGLSVCRRLVERQGGDIRAENRPEGGLAVKFALPVYEEGSPNQTVKGQSPASA
jgi:PAS domain S-box-containing protein